MTKGACKHCLKIIEWSKRIVLKCALDTFLITQILPHVVNIVYVKRPLNEGGYH